MKHKENPNHHMGKQTGYTLIDGVYHVAPSYVNQFAELSHRAKGIEAMLAAVTSHAAKDLEDISKASGQLWARLGEDLGINVKDNWSYQDGKVYHPSESKEKP